MPVSGLNDIIEEQIDWWRWQDWRPYEAWDALGGSGVVLVVNWDDVRNLMARHVSVHSDRKAA